MIAFRTYVKGDVAAFYRTSDAFGAFSNMHGDFPLEVAGLTVPSTEAFYQAMRFPHLPDFQREILEQETPILSKRHAYTRLEESRSDWLDGANIAIMRHALAIRCGGHPERMRALFEASAGRSIVEISKRDNFWGTFKEGDILRGRNVLGRLWMERRQLHLDLSNDEAREIAAPSYPEALLCGIQIEAFTSRPAKNTQSVMSL